MRRVEAVVGRGVVDLYRLWRRVRNRAFSLGARGAFAHFGARSVIELPVRLGGVERIAVGDEVFFGAGGWLQVMGGADSDPIAIRIGNRSSFAGRCVVTAVRSVEIGEGVLFARNVYVSDHSHRFTRPGVSILDQGVDEVRPVVIEDDAWLGQNVVVLPGVRVGRGAVIGANSVVTSDVPPRSVAVGAPARVVRHIDRVPPTPERGRASGG